MTETVTWLHISDTHFCNKKNGCYSQEIVDRFFDDLIEMNSKYGLYPDLIFFTGDLAFGHIGDSDGLSLEDQYKESKKFFDKVCDIFPKVPVENIFIVPGNHDVNRTQIAESENYYFESLREDKNGAKIVDDLLRNNKLDFQRCMVRLNEFKHFLNSSSYQHLLQDPDRLIYSKTCDINGFKVGIAGLNSAWSSHGENEKGKLLFGISQIFEAHNKLKDSMLSIAISHHPPNWFTEFEDTSMGREIENKFNFYLHGHEHQEWVSVINEHIRIASGALYDDKQKTGYNFVRLFPYEKYGEVFLRTFSNDKWVPKLAGSKTDNEGRWKINLSMNFNKKNGYKKPTPDLVPNLNISNSKLSEKINKDFVHNEQELNILVLGDVMLDRTMYVTDAPYNQVSSHDDLHMVSVLITEDTMINNLKITSSDRCSLGGVAGTIATLLEIPKVHVDMVGIIGKDVEGKKIDELFNNLNNTTHSEFHKVIIDEYPTITKYYYHHVNRQTTGKRVSAIYRYDREDKKFIKEHIEEYEDYFRLKLNDIERIAKKNNRKYDCIFINDYEKGMLNNHSIKWIEKIQDKYPETPIFVDPKYNFELYSYVRIKAIIPNIKEATMGIREVAKLKQEDVEKRVNDSELNNEDYEILKGYLPNCDSFVIKSDKKGAVIYSKDEDNNYSKVSILPLPIKVNRDNTIGCGDTFDAYFIIGQLKGYSLQNSVSLANIAAGIKRRKELGEVVLPKEVYNEIISNENISFNNEIISFNNETLR
mgnify:CR=1 FL=1|jgi:bifunctional ADP-heptose synthase (sugar kinase/adenylyltransferase)/3',5'-cyclic AMP phosphodiesterase CpdA